jgi:hypothetical protein
VAEPWEQGESIFAAVTATPAAAAEPAPLPDDAPRDPSTIAWGPGAWEGVATRHIGGAEPRGIRARLRRLVRRGDDDGPDGAVALLRQLAEHPSDAHRLALYRLGQRDDLLHRIDPILERVAADRELLAALAPHARWLITEARHRGPVKLGVALLGASGDSRDADMLIALARHDEFTLYCCVAVQNLLGDATDALWEIARTAPGWGKIEAVQRLTALVEDRPDIRRWLLVDGCRNAIMDEYLAYPCATAGGLAAALEEDVDDPLLDGACTIVAALCEGGPAEDLDDYADADVALDRLLGRLESRCTTLERLDTVVRIARRGSMAPERRERARRILADPAWPDRLHAAFASGDARLRGLAWEAAPEVGADLWDAGFDRLTAEPLDAALVWMLMSRGTPERRRRVVTWAEAHLPLDALATGPDEHLFPAADVREPANALAFVVQELGREVHSGPLVAAALRSPVVSIRNAALDAVEATPRAGWGPAVERALAQLAADEPRDDVRARVTALHG